MYWLVWEVDILCEFKKRLWFGYKILFMMKSFFKIKINIVYEFLLNIMFDCDVIIYWIELWFFGFVLICWRLCIYIFWSLILIYWVFGVWEKWCGVYFWGKFLFWFFLMLVFFVYGIFSRRGFGGMLWCNILGLLFYFLFEIDVCLL